MKNLKNQKYRLLTSLTIIGVFILLLSCPNLEAVPSSKKELRSPVRIAFGPADNLIVSDYNAKSIFTIDRNKNTVLKGFKIDGRPLAVAYLKGKIFVGNNTSKKIEVYTESGKMKYSFSGKIKKPNDMAIDNDGEKVYVVDTISAKVNIYTIEGKLISVISENLTAPTGIALDGTNGFIYVSDYGDPGNWIYPSIRIFNSDGTYSGVISGKLGMFGNRFSRPQGLAIDGNGYVFMVDCYSSEIMVFNGPGGILIKTMSGFGTEAGKMMSPLDIVINSKTKDLFVTNNSNSSIEIFKKGGEL